MRSNLPGIWVITDNEVNVPTLIGYSILAIDPGITTGLALAYRETDRLYIAPNQERLKEIDLYNLISDIGPTHLVCENFTYRRGQARPDIELFSRNLIGVVNLARQKLFAKTLTLQEAAEGLGHFSDSKLKQRQVYVKNMGHAMDAVRHLLHWHTFGPGFQYGDPPLQLVEWVWLTQGYFRG